MMRDMVQSVIAKHRLKHDPYVFQIHISRTKKSTKIDEILSGLDDQVENRAESNVSMSLKDKPLPFEWEFSVTSGGPDYTVIVRALVDEEDVGDEEVHVRDMDVKVSCSCPYWRWQGPEYHGIQDDYQYQSPRGTASPPDIRDPERDNHVCKHVAHVLEIMSRSPIYTVGE